MAGRTPRRHRKQLFLEVLEPAEQAGRTFDLDEELTIGRSPGCGVPTSYDVYSSTLHARLYHEGGKLWVEDLGSTNGTFVNGQPARRVVLADGTTVTLGRTTMIFRTDMRPGGMGGGMGGPGGPRPGPSGRY